MHLSWTVSASSEWKWERFSYRIAFMEMTHTGGRLESAPSDLRILQPGMKLADLPIGAEARVLSVSDQDSNAAGDLGRRLAELGFLPGEKLRIVARGFLGREPIAVRIGTGTFALRLFEAACVRVSPEPLPS
jgi:ferrous iron transport protein A